MTRAYLLTLLERALGQNTKLAREFLRISAGEVIYRMPRRPWFARAQRQINGDHGGITNVIADVAFLAVAIFLDDDREEASAKDAVFAASREVEKSLRRQYEAGNPSTVPLPDDEDTIDLMAAYAAWNTENLTAHLPQELAEGLDPETYKLIEAIAEGRTVHAAAKALGYRRPRLAYERLSRAKEVILNALS